MLVLTIGRKETGFQAIIPPIDFSNVPLEQRTIHLKHIKSRHSSARIGVDCHELIRILRDSVAEAELNGKEV